MQKKVERVLFDLRWCYARYNTLYVLPKIIADYTRMSNQTIQKNIEASCYGEGHYSDHPKVFDGYNLIDVVTENLGLDSESKIAIKSYMTSAVDKMKEKNTTKSKGTKKKAQSKEPKTTKYSVRKDGRLTRHVTIRKGVSKHFYGWTEEEVEASIAQAKLEDQQLQFLEKLNGLPEDKVPAKAREMANYIQNYQAMEKANNTKHDAVEIRFEETMNLFNRDGYSLKVAVPTFHEVAIDYIATLRREGTIYENSINSYESIYKVKISRNQKFIHMPMTEMKNVDVLELFKGFIGSCTLYTFEHIITVFKGILNHFEDNEEWENLTHQIKRDKLQRDLAKLKKRIPPSEKGYALSEEQINEALKQIDLLMRGNNMKARYFLMKLNFYMGLRIGELTALDEDDIDLENRRIYIREEVKYITKSVTCPEGKTVRDTPKTKAGIRDIPILDEAIPIIEAFMAYRKERRYKNKWLYWDGKDTTENAIHSMLKAYETVEKHLDFRYHCHKQRKSFASMLVNKGVPPTNIQKILGHESFQTTMSHYILPLKSYCDDTLKTLAEGTKAVSNDEIVKENV